MKQRANIWTPEQEQQLAEMYQGNTPAAVIAKRLRKSTKAVYTKAYRLGLGDQERQQIAVKRSAGDLPISYIAGREARVKRKPCVCPAADPVNTAWWKAGWHDRDMEMGVSVLEGNAA